MTRTKRIIFDRVLNSLMAFAAGGALSISFAQIAHAGAQSPNDFFERWCRNPSKKLSKAMQRKCDGAQEEMFRNWVAQLNLDSSDPTTLRSLIYNMKVQYLKLDQKSQALIKTNDALERQHDELKRKASQSCSVVTQPQNQLKRSVGTGYIPFSSELSGPGDQDSSSRNGIAK